MEFITNLATQAWAVIGPYAVYVIGAVLFMVLGIILLITLLVAARKRKQRRRRLAEQAAQTEAAPEAVADPAAESSTTEPTAEGTAVEKTEDASDELRPAESAEAAIESEAEIKEVQASTEGPTETPEEHKAEAAEVEGEKAEAEGPAEVVAEAEEKAEEPAEPAEASSSEEPEPAPVAAATAPPAETPKVAPPPMPAGPVKFQDFSDLRPAHFESFQGDEWEADLDEAGDDEVIHQAGEVEGEGASMYLDLNRQDEYHAQQYNRARGLFHHQLRECVHDIIEPETIFRPGMTGRPVQDTFPSIFWRDMAMLFDEEAHRRADALIPELYFHAIRHEAFDPSASELDADVLTAMVNYALWKGKSDWIHTLAFRVLEDEIRVPGLAAAAALTARAAGREAEADYFLGRVEAVTLYTEACFHALGGEGDRGAPTRSRLDELDENERLKLDWFAAAAGNDYLRESEVVDELMAKAGDAETVLDIARGLFLRGRLFKAVRLLDRHASESNEFRRIVLQLHFRNGKNRHFLKRLYKMKSPLTRGNWYELHYAVRLLGGDEAKADGIFKKLAAQRGGDPPPERDQAKFIRHLRAVDAGRFDPAAATPVKYGDVLAHSLFYVQRGRQLNDTDKQREHVRRILKVFRNNLEDVQDLFRLEILLRSVFWSFMFIRERDLVRRFLPYLESMAGRNQALRIFVGLYYGENGRATQAVQYLQKAPRHPLVLHRLADIYAGTGDTREAENAYHALLAEYPNEALFWFNYGLLLEKNEKRAEANRAYHRALELNPDLESARERISALLEMKVG